MRKLFIATLVAVLTLSLAPTAAYALSAGTISITGQTACNENSQEFNLNGSGFSPSSGYSMVFQTTGGTLIPFATTTNSAGAFTTHFRATGITTYIVTVRTGTTVLSNILSYTVCGAVTDLTPKVVTPPNIVMTVDDSKCGQVTVTAHGFGLLPGETYQMVAGNGYPAATKTVMADVTNTAQATFTMAEAGDWGNATMRTSAGGFLLTTNAWYHVRACSN